MANDEPQSEALGAMLAKAFGLPPESRYLCFVFLTPSGEPDRDVRFTGHGHTRQHLTARERESLLTHFANWIVRHSTPEADRDPAGRLNDAGQLLRRAAKLADEWAQEVRRPEHN